MKRRNKTLRQQQNVQIGTAQQINRAEIVDEIVLSSATLPSGGIFQINPGNQSLFKWLSSLSTAYRNYKFLELEFQFKPTCSTFKNGQIIYYFVEDNDNLPVDISNAKMNQPSVQQACYRPVSLKIPKNSLNRLSQYYIRNVGSTDPNEDTDPRLHDVGYFGWFAQGDVGSVGTLIVKYKVKLIYPKTAAPNPTSLAQPLLLNTAIQTTQASAVTPVTTSGNISTLLSNADIALSEANTLSTTLSDTITPWVEGLNNIVRFSNPGGDGWRIRGTFLQDFVGAVNLTWPIRVNYLTAQTVFPTLSQILEYVQGQTQSPDGLLPDVHLVPIANSSQQSNTTSQQTIGLSGNITGDFGVGDYFELQLKSGSPVANYTFANYYTFDPSQMPTTTSWTYAVKRLVFSMLLIPMAKSYVANLFQQSLL